MSKLISIVIPYFKKKDHIKKTLKSIYSQTYQNFEIIIIYDDPNQEDISFLRKILNKNYKTKIVINKKNLGAGFSRNEGILHSSGDYIAFLDADDYWYKNKLSYQIKFMINNKVDFSFTSYLIVDTKNKILKKIPVKNKLFYSDLIRSCDIGLSTVILKKSILEKIKFPNLKTKEDYVFWLLISKKNILYGIDIPLSNWVKTSKSLSSDVFQKIKDGFLVYSKYLKINIFLSVFYTLRLSINFLKKRYL